MKAVIFGASGQDGHYLAELCRQKNIEPVGVSRSGSHVHGDVRRYDQVEGVIREHRPAFVFHLAAHSTTRHSALFDNHETISTGTLNILEAVKNQCPDAKVFITGSGVQFKNSGAPISEKNEFEANSAYSLARIHSVYAARYYRLLGMKTFVGYLFHHESPLRKPNHVSQIIVQAARRIAGGSTEMLELGDISVEKEWTFAGDVARGMFALVEQNDVFEAAIGSGKPYAIEQWLDHCFHNIGKNWKDHVRLREGYAPEYGRLVSDPKTMNTLGWFPHVELQDLAKMMMDSDIRVDV